MLGNCKPIGRWWHGNFFPEVRRVCQQLRPCWGKPKVVADPLPNGRPQAHTLPSGSTYIRAIVVHSAGPLGALRTSLLLELLFMSPMGERNTAHKGFSRATHNLHVESPSLVLDNWWNLSINLCHQVWIWSRLVHPSNGARWWWSRCWWWPKEIIKCSNLEKKKEKNKNQVLIKTKVSNRFLFWWSRYHRECDHV